MDSTQVFIIAVGALWGVILIGTNLYLHFVKVRRLRRDIADLEAASTIVNEEGLKMDAERARLVAAARKVVDLAGRIGTDAPDEAWIDFRKAVNDLLSTAGVG